jgi:dihydrofolate reductase
MRTVTFGGANSLDNYFARKDDGIDWLLWSEEVADLMRDFWKTIDTVVMGRKTYEVMVRSGHGSGAYPGMTTYVFSRTREPRTEPGLEIVRGDVAPFVRDLKDRDGKGICVMGGGDLAKSLLEADLIDEIGLNVHPVLLGSGIPVFFEMKRQIDLELKECRVLKTGCVFLTYRVKH